MATAERNIGSQTERQSALSKELLGILAIGATLLVGQVSAFSLLRAEIAGLRDEMHTELSGVRGEMIGLRDEMHTELSGVRGEISGLRDVMHAELSGVRGETSGLRDEMHTELGGVRGEMIGLRDEMHTELSGVRGEISGLRDEVSGLRERMARVETHVEIIREDVAFLSGRRESPARSEPGP